MNRTPFDPARRAWLARQTMLAGGLGLAAAGVRAGHDHAGHAAAAGAGVARSDVQLQPADVSVLREDGQRQPLRRLLDDGRPVVLNFIYTSCTAICPVTTQVLRELRERLGARREQVLMVSASIDPENDTPARLAEYARRFGGGTPSWRFVTASLKDAVAIQTSFNAYQGDKMNHLPITFVRPARGSTWLRFDGFASPSLLLQTVQPMLEAAAAGGAPPNAGRRAAG